jgi:hypothetical protein
MHEHCSQAIPESASSMTSDPSNDPRLLEIKESGGTQPITAQPQSFVAIQSIHISADIDAQCARGATFTPKEDLIYRRP